MTNSAGDDATIERNKAQFRLLQEEVVCKKRVELVEQIMAPDFSVKRGGTSGLARALGKMPARPSGGDTRTERERFIDFHKMVSPLTDFETTVEEINGEGDVVWARWRVRATHSGEMFGVPATGKRLDFIEIAWARFDDDGLMVEGWFMADEIELASQLGIQIG